MARKQLQPIVAIAQVSSRRFFDLQAVIPVNGAIRDR